MIQPSGQFQLLEAFELLVGEIDLLLMTAAPFEVDVLFVAASGSGSRGLDQLLVLFSILHPRRDQRLSNTAQKG
jgi:hypothetical protein